MADFQITDKAQLTSVDRATDSLLIYDASASALKRATVDNLTDLTSHPVGVDDTQTLTNKTITNPTITIRDNVLTIQDNSDPTKQIQFQLSGLTTGTTRTLTIPNASTTLVGTDATQTLTNKTLTSPTITTATIANPTLTVDTISEYTAANGVNIDGLLIKDGLLPAGNIQPLNLTSGTGSSWSWQSWTPTWTNLTVGNGTVDAKYIQIGKAVFFRVKVFFGSTTSIAGAIRFTTPVTAIDYNSGSTTTNYSAIPGTVLCKDDSAGTIYSGPSLFYDTGSFTADIYNVGSTYPTAAAITSSVPFTWATNDVLAVTGSYEAA